ncbi:type I-D CRISPR-associated protein Cas5/Csc1 [Leptolyngbya sp. FACHB-261]|uniref:type I-D CRISPR-associated protein Cas5/Csc1 n=1 Tax=Leptolyngbya sp. FACHB-261 TaxID=2692806 RepID=UPI0016871367|nr:type I-D CRISPR-associated protein Cas5/Csc1 [Leptolyngbya sp. FACHB-261]MBD2102392.1 type I-D CRISPR-associated protein Cas5/Csc1 [Leptolyngbya sp. FACHB-261]
MPAQLNLLDKAESATTPRFNTAKLVELWCAEPVFFASRELSDTYYTEGAIGNYALAYAFGWARSPYRLTSSEAGRPRYIEDLTPLNHECYVLPAWSANGSPTFRFERFNALSDAYWYAMTNNRVATAREDVLRVRRGDKPNTFRPSNYPQTGRLRLIERNNRFHTLVFGNHDIPEYIRLGKFMSKVRVQILEEMPITNLPAAEYSSQAYFSTADLPSGINLLSFDLISIPPTPLVKNLRFHAEAWQAGNFIVPANLQFCGGGVQSGV